MRAKAVALYTSLMLMFKPPERMKVHEWADKNRQLSSESASTPGRWRSERTPYMIPIMEAFTDPRTHHIYVKACAQVGKSELLNSCFGYLVCMDPGPVLWIHPTVQDAEDYSKQRLDQLIQSTPALLERIAPDRSKNKGNTILKKRFAGGFLSLVGSNAPSGLRSRPIRYLFGDEWDAWARSAGQEGDPAKLAEKRTATFFNFMVLMVSTPTIKGDSPIDDAFLSGTQEEWRLPCPNCGEYHYTEFKDIEFQHTKEKKGREIHFTVTGIVWRCPDCGFAFSEAEMKRQQGKMIACNPAAFEKGVRSFRFNAWISPWQSWEYIILEFLQAGNDPYKLQVVYNTLFGEVFEDRGDLEDADEILARREEYGAEVPDGALVLTCAVDTQDDRLEYEVLGHGHFGETWGIRYGVIPGDPANPEVWAALDEVIDKTYYLASGRGLRISITFVDSGGHRTPYVYEACRVRALKKVFAIKGMNTEDAPHVGKPKILKYVVPNTGTGNDKKIQRCWYYPIGSSEGKSHVMSALKVQEAGPKYCHFPSGDRGYTQEYFDGLLSERLTFKRIQGKNKWVWDVLPGHQRNEPLDIRNYNLAAFKALTVDLRAIERKLKGQPEPPPKASPPAASPPPRRRRSAEDYYDDW